MANPEPKDLVVVVEGKGDKLALEALLRRHKALGIRPLRFDCVAHPHRGSGCRGAAVELLRRQQWQFTHALVVFDRVESVANPPAAEELEQSVREDLLRAGWTQAAAIVIDPELEAWAWTDSTALDTVLGWEGRSPDLRTWLAEEGWLQAGATKPCRPKEALEAALRRAGLLQSAAILGRIAEQVSFRRCSDPAFLRFLKVLRGWFPIEAHP